MRVFERPYRRPIYGKIMGWIYRKLGYDTEVIIRFQPDAILGLPFDAVLVLRCTKENSKQS